MRGVLKSFAITVLILGVGLALWKTTGGDVGGFFDTVGNILYTIIDSVANFFINLFSMFFGSA